jgi:GxxExxY protein
MESLISAAVDTGFHIHNELGPGLLESLYESVLAGRLEGIGIVVKRQVPIDVVVDGVSYANAYRIDLLLNDWLAIEVKAVEQISGLHIRQAQTYVKLLQQPIGLLMNFGCESYKNSVRRIYSNRI